jgi:hypothetical protein
MTIVKQVLQITLSAALLISLVALPGKADGPPYKVSRNMVERSITMVDYRLHSGTTKLDLRPTALLPDVHGNVEVEGKNGLTEIKIKLEHITPASFLGPEYLTYVLWAVTSDGGTMNLTELLPNEDDKAECIIAVDLPVFGLIITAEPYFAVNQPSDFIAMEMSGIPDEGCFIKNRTVTYQLLERGQYYAHIPAREVTTIYSDRIEPIELTEAKNALRIAWWSNAAIYAPEPYAEAKNLLQEAEVSVNKYSRVTAITARTAVQAAEIATSTAIRRQTLNSDVK